MSVLISKDVVREPLYCVIPLFNPWRWKSRYKHTERALKHFHHSGAVIILVEIAFGHREFVFADSGLDGTPANCGLLGSDPKFRHRYIGLRTKDELWLKENSINVEVGRALPFDWQYVCWLDSDVQFARPNWTGECVQKLQHYDVLQMFSQARDLGPNYEMLPENYPHANGVGFVQSWKDGDLAQNLRFKMQTSPVQQDIEALKNTAAQLTQQVNQLEQDFDYYGGGGPRRVFPGLCWAQTRRAWDTTGGLLDWAIWGGGDWHMAHALVGKLDGMMHSQLHDNYKQMTMSWYRKAEKGIRRNVGVMEGTVFHNWHGRKTERGYGDKHRILARAKFDPIHHLSKDYQVLYQLHDDGGEQFIQLRDSFRQIARERNEDSIDV